MMQLIHNWIGIVSSFLYFSLAITAQANSLSIQTEFWEHQLRKDLFHSGGTVQNLNSGFLFGMNKVHATALPPKNSATAEGLKEEYEFLIGSLKKQNKTLDEEKERIKEIIRQKSFEIPEKEKGKEKVVQETHEEQKIPSPLSFDWDQFYECTKKTLPTLKNLIGGEVQMRNLSSKDQASRKASLSASLFELRQEVQANRGDGSQGGAPQGVACGRFLGAAGFTNGSLKEDVKILAAISSREEEEARLLTKALIASHHQDLARDNPEAFQQWRYFWNELSVKAVFYKDPLPPLSVFEELRVGDVGDFGEVLKESIRKYTQDGLTFSEEKLQ